MKILFISTGHSLDDARVTRKEGATLAHLGNDVTVCAQYRAVYSDKILHIPFVFDVHEGYERNIPLIFPKILQPVMRVIIDWLMRCIVRASTGITACTNGCLCNLIYNSPPALICYERYIGWSTFPRMVWRRWRKCRFCY